MAPGIYNNTSLSWRCSSALSMGDALERLLNFCRLTPDGITPIATANSQSFRRGLGIYWVWVHLSCDNMLVHSIVRLGPCQSPRPKDWFEPKENTDIGLHTIMKGKVFSALTNGKS